MYAVVKFNWDLVLSSLSISNCQYPQVVCRVVETVALPMEVLHFLMLGIGYESCRSYIVRFSMFHAEAKGLFNSWFCGNRCCKFSLCQLYSILSYYLINLGSLKLPYYSSSFVK